MTLTVRLESATENALASFCSSQTMTKSQVVHEALGNWFKSQSASIGHPLLGFMPQPPATGKRTSNKVAASSALHCAYEPYSKAALRSKVTKLTSSKKP